MANWGDIFASAFAGSYQNAQEMALKKKQMQQEAEQWQQEQTMKQQQIGAFLGQFGGGMQGVGIPPTGGVSAGVTGENAQYIKVPDYNSPVGFRLEVNPSWKAEQAAGIRGEAKTREAQQKAASNFGRVASAVKLYSDYYANALKEGGVGGLLAREKGKLVTQQIGGTFGERMPETGKLFGQRAELSLAMVPILTNQNRFMSSIMEYINQSLPQGHEGAKLALGKLEQTLINQYSTSKVLSRLGYNPDNPDEVSKIDVMNDEEAGALAKKVIDMAKVYKLSKEEQKEFDAIKQDVLGSLLKSKYTKTGRNKKGQKVGMLPDGTVEVIDE